MARSGRGFAPVEFEFRVFLPAGKRKSETEETEETEQLIGDHISKAIRNITDNAKIIPIYSEISYVSTAAQNVGTIYVTCIMDEYNLVTRGEIDFAISDLSDMYLLPDKIFNEILPLIVRQSGDVSRTDPSDLHSLALVSAASDGLLEARDGRIDLAGTSATDRDITPRAEAARLAVEDLIEACSRSNRHAELGHFAKRYRDQLDGLGHRRPGLTWYVVALRIESYRAHYAANSGRDPAEYPPLEPAVATLIDSILVATAMLARVLPEIAHSQDQIRQYTGDQLEVRAAVRDLIDPALSDLSHTEGVLTPRAAEVSREAVAINIGTLPPGAPETERIAAAKTGIVRGFLEAVSQLAVAGSHQISLLRENVRTKAGYDIGKEIVKWLIDGGYGKTLGFLAASVSTLVALADRSPALFGFVHPLLRVLGLHP